MSGNVRRPCIHGTADRATCSECEREKRPVLFLARQVDELAQRVKDLEERVRTLEAESNASVADFAEESTPVGQAPQFVCALCGRPASGVWIKSQLGPLCAECGEKTA